MQTSFPISPAWYWRLGIGLFVAVVFCLWLITFAYHRVAKANFEAHVAELAAKGESLEVDDLRPPPIENPEDDVGAAPVFAEFLARCRANPKADAGNDPVWGELDLKAVPGYSVDRVQRDENQVRYLTHPPLSQGFDPPDEEAAARAILAHGEVHAAILTEIREALIRPRADFNVPYGDFAAPHPGLTGFNSAGKFLNRQGRAALLLGRVELAKSNSIAMLRFSRHLGSGATVIHGLVGNTMQSFAIFVVHEGLVTGKWREEDLVAIAEELEPRWAEAAFLSAIRMERATAQEFWERAKKEPKMWSTWGDEGVRLFLHLPELRKGWYFDNLEHYNRTMQESFLEDADGRIKTKRISIPLREIPTIHPSGSDVRDQFRFQVETFRHGFAESAFAVFSGIQIKVLRSQVFQDHALIAIALALHQRKHATFPATLDSLTLPSGAPLPLDPFTGAAYVYRPEGDNDYLLYSPGPNGLDDGGLIRHRYEDGDWVWRLHLPEDFDYDAYRGR